MILPIVTYGHQALVAQAKSVEIITDGVAQFCDDLVETMKSAGGVGLAANQVGSLQRIIAIDEGAIGRESWIFNGGFKNPADWLPLVIINPKIQCCPITENGKEGCLSIPDVFETVRRASMIHVTGISPTGNDVEFECGGWLARVIQHEVDHLNGKSFYEHLPPDRKAALLKKYARLRGQNH